MPNNHPIPRSRPKGSPYARAYGETTTNGTPVDALARKVEKELGRKPAVAYNRPAGSPLAAAQGATDPNGYPGISKTLDALRLAFSTPGGRGRVTKDKGLVLVACYDAGGNLLGTADAADIQSLSPGTPVQPATPQTTAPDPEHMTVGDPAAQPDPADVAKALRIVSAINKAVGGPAPRRVTKQGAKTRVTKAQTQRPGVLVMRRVDE
jgi:hypothetical protein